LRFLIDNALSPVVALTTLTYQTTAANKSFMSHPRVIVPRIGVSFEGTRELFGLSASDATKATRLADQAFEQSKDARSLGVRVKRKTAAARRSASKKAKVAARRK
jgi:hypothetical protein